MIKYKNKSRSMCQILIIMIILYMIIPTVILISLGNESFEMIIISIGFYLVSLLLAIMLYMIRFQFYCTKYDNDCIIQNLFWYKKSINFNEIKTLILINENICLLKKKYTKMELEEIFIINKRKNKMKFMKNNVCINVNVRDYNFVDRITSLGAINYYIVDKPNAYVLKIFSNHNFISLNC